MSARDLRLAPVSPAMAQLLHQLQAQIIREAEELTTGRDRFGPLWEPKRTDRGDRITWTAENGTDTWVRRRFCPERWGTPGGMPWHPSHWLFDCERVDAYGRKWTLNEYLTIEPHVMDDFGDLQKVPQ